MKAFDEQSGICKYWIYRRDPGEWAVSIPLKHPTGGGRMMFDDYNEALEFVVSSIQIDVLGTKRLLAAIKNTNPAI